MPEEEPHIFLKLLKDFQIIWIQYLNSCKFTYRVTKTNSRNLIKGDQGFWLF